MSVIYFLVPIGLVMLGLAIWAFIWAVNNHQFEDMENKGQQILYDDKEERQALEKEDKIKSNNKEHL